MVASVVPSETPDSRILVEASGPIVSEELYMTAAPQATKHAKTGSNEEPVVEMRDVHKSFGPLEVLRGVDLTLRQGHTTVIIGESGAGKSVILKHICALLRPDRGRVFFHGRRIDNMTEKNLVQTRKRFGVLFQMGALFDSMSAGENIGFPIHEHTTKSKAEIKRIVSRKLRMVGLDGLEQKRPAELSGGQRKRVALARAIALDPEVILYDEPTTGLDPVRADVINELILKLARELAVTSLVVTHDMTSAFKVGDRIVMLYEGSIIADGTPDEIRASTDARVQRFIQGNADPDDLAALRTKE
jgi:phospholipid/cholesterol/gamma-HCH transport system ATP-binding protein